MSETGQPGSSRGEIRLNLFGRTDVGQIREHNEDNFLIANLTTGRRSLMEEDRTQTVGPNGCVFAVCDGMGGAAAGEVASQFAIDIVHEKLTSSGSLSSRDELARRLVATVEEAGLRIFNEARADRTRRGMGTTATVAALVDDRLFIGQVGDSRAYVLRGDQLIQVTRDQSLVNQLIEAGQLTEEEAETFEHNNIILQALGTSETVQVDLTYVDLRRGDTLLLCSDGLSGMIRGEEIRQALLATSDPFEACRLLTDRANEAGGHDNITVVVVQFDGEGLAEPEAADEPVAYRKYALPDSGGTMDATVRPGETAPMIAPQHHQGTQPTPSQGLRVGHTMVGMTNPFADPAAAQPGASPGAPRPRQPWDRETGDEPIELPTSGLPPQVVGAMVVGALLVVAFMGFLLLR